jgi:signal transduction histidine kinase
VSKKPTYEELEQKVRLLEEKSSETQKKLAVLSREKREFLSIFASLDVGIYVSDPETYEILYANPTIRRTYPGQHIIGKKCHRVLQARDEPCDFCTHSRIFGENKGRPYMWDFQNPANGQWYHCIDKAIQWPDGRWVRWQMAINIHEQKRAEQDLLESKRKLERLLEIEDKMTSLGRIAAGMAHEIRSPLSGINLLLDNLRSMCCSIENKEIGSDTVQEIRVIIEKALSASNKIEKVVKRVLDFSRPNDIKRVLADINQPIQDALKLSSVTLRKEGIHIETALSPDCPQCYVDPDMVEQMMMGLITNAIEAMENSTRDKKIEINSSKEGSSVIIRVSDSGPGVPLQLRNKIFEPFFTTKPYGSGIGLSICHRIATDHRGFLEVSSSKYGGAEFTVRIPVPSSQEN